MTNKLLLLLTLFALISCGGMTKNEDEEFVEQEDTIEVVNTEEETDDIVVLDEDIDNEEPAEAVDEGSAQVVAESEGEPEGDSNSQEEVPAMADSSMYQYGEHTVAPGETLGVIAAKIYGDFRKWRSIYLENEEKLGATKLTAGTVLKYRMPADGEVIRPEGNPYLILRNETLGIISAKVYDGSAKHWKKIWKNNHKLIWDPNLIFAGLTIFTPELNQEREVANKL